MVPKVLILSGSPKKDGNTDILAGWFAEGVRAQGGSVEFVRAATLKLKAVGCTSCRACQKREHYGCVIEDDVAEVLKRLVDANVIVLATPLYFFGPSAQLKSVFDRWFSLYKWDNDTGTMTTVLKGKAMVLLASAFEDVGLDELARPFEMTAKYTGMTFASLLVPNAGVSGDIVKLTGIQERAVSLGRKIAEERS